MTQHSGLDELPAEVRDFAAARDWGQFHRPRSLLLALAGEVGELAAELQWVSDEEVSRHLAEGDSRRRFEEEMADVLIYLLHLAEVTDVDLGTAVRCKLVRNEQRYPVELTRGRAERPVRAAEVRDAPAAPAGGVSA